MKRQQTAKFTKANSTSRDILRAQAAPQKPTPVHPVLQLQRAIGNQAVHNLLSSGGIQAKLSISHPDDPYEREADRVADTVMRMPAPAPPDEEETAVQAKPLTTQISPFVQRESQQPLEEEKEQVVATKPLVQRVPIAVREDDEEEKVAPKLEPDAELQEEEKEKPVQAKLETDATIQRQAIEDEKKEEEPLQSMAPIQRQMEDEDEEPVQTKPLSGGAIQRFCTECEGEKHQEVEKPAEMVQRKSARHQLHDDHDEEEQLLAKGCDSATPSVTPSVAANIHSMNHGGSPLPQATRGFFEPRFSADFSQVQIHTDGRTAATARSINARAFTVGQNIAFGAGEYSPHSREGRQLLAHELTHVVQQNGKHLQRARTQAKEWTAKGGAPPERGKGPLNFLSTMADTVMRNADPAPATVSVQRMPDKAAEPAPAAHAAHAALAGDITSLRGGGAALPPSTRAFFEPRMGADLGHVRVHTNTKATDTAASLHARAFTVGNDIAFGAGQYAPESEDGKRLLAHELTHVRQQADTTQVQRWEWPWEDSDEEKLEKHRKSQEVDAIVATQDYSKFTEAQRLEMLHKLISQNRADSEDERAIERLWNSFGKEFSRIAGENGILWVMCSNRIHTLFDLVPEAKRIRDAFAGDAKEIAMRNMSINQKFAEEEMERLGLPRTIPEMIKEPTAAQAGELARLQVAAEGVAKLQAAQEAARAAAVGYAPVRIGGLDEPGYMRVPFDTNKPPPLTTLPGNIRQFYDDANEKWVKFAWGLPPATRPVELDEGEAYMSMLAEKQRLTAIVPYAPIKASYDQATAAIVATLALHPQLYALTVQNKASVVGELANADSPRKARDVLAEAFRELLRNIERTRRRLGDDDLDPLDLKPIHRRMFENKEAVPSEIDWSQAFPRAVAERLTFDHNMDVLLRRLLLQTIAQLAFMFAPIAGPLAIPLLMVGVGASAINLEMDLARYQALADAARAGAKPGTELVDQGQVDEARMAVEADKIALLLGVLTLGAVAGSALIRRFQAAAQARLLAQRTRLMNQAGAPSGVTTLRGTEVPYGLPEAEVQVVKPGSPLKLDKLDPKRRYLWVLDEEGNFRIADEGQAQRFPRRRQLQKGEPGAGETPLKHGDLAPGPGGQTRGVARAGGELSAELDAGGKPTGRWIMNNNSSYTFVRTDAQTLTAANLDAAKALMKTTGTDVTRIVTKVSP